MKVSPKRVEPIPSAQLGAAPDRHSEPIRLERPGTTGEIVGGLTHSARQEVATVQPIEPIRLERPGTTEEIVGGLTHSARHGVATVQVVELILLGP
jgi:4'-phosphopantetheinyl transferase EntD